MAAQEVSQESREPRASEQEGTEWGAGTGRGGGTVLRTRCGVCMAELCNVKMLSLSAVRHGHQELRVVLGT